ncbi:uncharacterized protein, partial [Littorina saxatilis]|uniref:uncharacterized protein n=1 Tax=Littorina saxatilis TaxID=31220 RepID=UPI0038B6AD40
MTVLKKTHVLTGISLPQCTDGAIELTEGVAGQTITCTGTSSTQQVSWRYDSLTLATCNAPSNCETQFTFVTPTRDDSTSTLTFPGAMTRSLLGNSSITCTLAGTPPQTSNCSIDVIYAADKPTCSISSKRDNSDPKLNGVCTINKAFSSIGRYDCLWFQRHGNAQGTPIPEDMTSVTSPVMIPGTDSNPYYAFNCSFEVTLPLEAGLYNYTVFVQPGSAITSTTYNINSTSQLNVTLNNNTANLTVTEGDQVTVTCTANGRPTPSLQLFSQAGQEETLLNQTDGGDNMLEDRVTSLNYVIISAECRHTATYQCGPRLQEPVNTDPFELHYKGYPVHLSVDMLAFPLPDTFTFEFNGQENNVSESVTPGNLDSRCWTTFAAYAVTCNVTVNKMTSGDAGFYSVWIGNSAGNFTISFEVKYFEPDPQAGESFSTGAAVGVALALVFVVVGVVFVLMWRRHWVLPCASSTANESNNTEHNQAAVSHPVSVEREEQQNASSNEMPADKQQATNQYEILQPLDIGVRSDYAELSHCHADVKSDDGAGKEEEILFCFLIPVPPEVKLDQDLEDPRLQIQECNNGQVETVENTASSLTCVDYTGTVTWQYRSANTGTLPVI